MGNTKERRFIFRGPSSSAALLRFREPTQTAADVLFGRIVDGSYDKPFLVEDLEFRAMCFALDGSTQSEMRLDDPVALVSTQDDGISALPRTPPTNFDDRTR